MKMKKSYKDTDLREALRRKYSDSPQLPADFMEKMQERFDALDEAADEAPDYSLIITGMKWR